VGIQVIDFRAHAEAPREAAWETLADITRWAEWGPWDETALEREGAPDPRGVGAMRMLRRGRIVTREEVTEWEPPAVLGYELRSGLPMRHYRARVTLTERDGGTELHWRSEFRAKLPGTGPFLRLAFGGFIADVVERAARDAESHSQD
jgi:hypothetical protein